MDRENYKMTKGTTVREWCENNNNYNLIKNWDYENNGSLTPENVARYSNVKINFVCHICGNKFSQKLIYTRCVNGCFVCKGNKYVTLGRNGDYTVYCHITPDGKRYVGFTGMRIKYRFANGNGYMYGRFGEAIKKYGWNNIKHIVLESGLSKEEASNKEIYYIQLYNTLDERYGYNISTGGIHGSHPVNHSSETIEKIRRSNIGQKRTENARKNMSIAHIGKDNHKSKEVYKIDKENNILALYKSCKEAALMNNGDRKSISRCATGRRKTYLGFCWKYKNDMEVLNE